ncbi:hypothetical protein OTK49_01595 [Vibrio coralliirubri]|uniref:hypothetical protein n=1 Tax=Vibrio coralliirubri TaxID=1516159 RepID=UPI00228418B9|nr:hypothetical protein [Vibrio coralliirubri]MCY9861219.1 hypothetical protein [Vibrio coralliirubri]
MIPINPLLNIALLIIFSLTLKGTLAYAINKRPTSPASQWVGAGLLMFSATGFGFGFMNGILNTAYFVELVVKLIQA